MSHTTTATTATTAIAAIAADLREIADWCDATRLDEPKATVVPLVDDCALLRLAADIIGRLPALARELREVESASVESGDCIASARVLREIATALETTPTPTVEQMRENAAVMLQ